MSFIIVTGREKNRADLFFEVFKMYKGWSKTSFDSIFKLNSERCNYTDTEEPL